MINWINSLLSLPWYQIITIILGCILAIVIISSMIALTIEEPGIGFFIGVLFVIYAAVFWIRIAFGYSGTANWVNAMIGCIGALIFIGVAVDNHHPK